MDLGAFARSASRANEPSAGEDWFAADKRASGYPFPLDLQLLGYWVGVQSEDAFRLDQLAQHFELPPGARIPGTGGAVDLRGSVERADAHGHPGGPSWIVTTDPPGVLNRFCAAIVKRPTSLASLLDRWAVDRTSRHDVFRSGAASPGGRAILLPAGSYRGKSALGAGLVRHGFELPYDEIGAIQISSGRQGACPSEGTNKEHCGQGQE